MLRHFAKAPSTQKREESTNKAIAKRAREYEKAEESKRHSTGSRNAAQVARTTNPLKSSCNKPIAYTAKA
jgi:hypothetical protein